MQNDFIPQCKKKKSISIRSQMEAIKLAVLHLLVMLFSYTRERMIYQAN